jgi:hypothetical protein
MAVGKIGGILLILIILACIGVFGSHFDVPMSGTTSLDRPQESLSLWSVMGFLFSAGTFQAEDVPFWLSSFIDILLIVFIVLIASMFIPTISG